MSEHMEVKLGRGDRGAYWTSLVRSFGFTLRDTQQWMARVALHQDQDDSVDYDLTTFILALQQADPKLAHKLLQYGVDGSEARQELMRKFKFDHPHFKYVETPADWPDFPCPILGKLMLFTNDAQWF